FFSLTTFGRIRITVNGDAPGGVANTSGQLLDGDKNSLPGGDAVLNFRILSNSLVTYRDHDSDRVIFGSSRGLRLDILQRSDGEAEQTWVVKSTTTQPLPNPILIGLLRSVNGSNRVTTLQELIGVGRVNISQVTTNPAFQIGRTTNGIIAILIG